MSSTFYRHVPNDISSISCDGDDVITALPITFLQRLSVDSNDRTGKCTKQKEVVLSSMLSSFGNLLLCLHPFDVFFTFFFFDFRYSEKKKTFLKTKVDRAILLAHQFPSNWLITDYKTPPTSCLASRSAAYYISFSWRSLASDWTAGV